MYRTGRKVVANSIILLLGIPLFYFSYQWFRDPGLCEGDTLEVRACRECGGSGQDPGLAEDYPELGDRCPACRGRGRVEVIVPGPVRPTRVWGAVVALRGGEEELYAYSRPEFLRAPPQLPFARSAPPPVPGAIAGAAVVFYPEEGEPIESETDSGGRFTRRLSPGSYTVEVSAPGYRVIEGEIVVEPLSEPIWLEKANIIRPPDSDAEARSRWGLEFLAVLAPEGEGGGFLRCVPGSP